MTSLKPGDEVRDRWAELGTEIQRDSGCIVRFGPGPDAMICGVPAPERQGMCLHEHVRRGPLCDEHAAYCLCRECYLSPSRPHKCLVRFAPARSFSPATEEG